MDVLGIPCSEGPLGDCRIGYVIYLAFITTIALINILKNFGDH